MTHRRADRRIRRLSGPVAEPFETEDMPLANPPGARLLEENERLRARIVETEARFGLIRDELSGLRKVHFRTTRHATEAQAECNRLMVENRQLQALADHPASASGAERRNAIETDPKHRHQGSNSMTVIRSLKGTLSSRWGLPAVLVAILLAREPAVRSFATSVAQRLSPARGALAGNDPASGYLGFARMVNAAEAYEKTRASYNARADSLKGDALLEAQDALRDARERFARARAEFVPALRDACERAEVPFPGQAAELLAAMKGRDAARE